MIHSLFYSGFRGDYHRLRCRDQCRHLHTSENSEQVLYRPCYGRHRTQHQHRQADPHRRQAAASGLLLLGRYHRRQPSVAACDESVVIPTPLPVSRPLSLQSFLPAARGRRLRISRTRSASSSCPSFASSSICFSLGRERRCRRLRHPPE